MRPFENRSFWWGFASAMIGVFIGASINALVAGAFDPCDPHNESPRIQTPRQSFQYDPNDDPAMQFYWRDHQPSLHAR